MALGTAYDLGSGSAASGTTDIVITSVNIPTADVAFCCVGSRNDAIDNVVSGSTVTWTELVNTSSDNNHLQIFVAQGINATESVSITRTGHTVVEIIGVPNASTTVSNEAATLFLGGANKSVSLPSASDSASTVIAFMYGSTTTAQTPANTGIHNVSSGSSRGTTQFFEGVITTMSWTNSGVESVQWAGEIVEAGGGPTTTPKSTTYTGTGTSSLSTVTTFQIQPNMTTTGTLSLIKLISKFLGMSATGTSAIQKTTSKSFTMNAIGTPEQREGLVVDQTTTYTATGTLSTATRFIIDIGGTIKRISRYIARNIVRNITQLMGD